MADDKFREMFYEEARELLIGLEEGLMDLERRQGDRAHLDRTFRAAHSLKGAAAMVGLDQIARFTHGIEAVLDRIRSGDLAVDSDIITTLLEARDHLAAMVEGEAIGAAVPASGELMERVAALLKGRGAPSQPAPAASPPALAAAPPAEKPTESVPEPKSAPDAPSPVVPMPAAAGPPVTPPDAAAVEPPSSPAPVKKAASRRTKKPPAEKKPTDEKKPRTRRAGVKGMAPEATPAPAAEGRVVGYRIQLTPGPDTMRRGVNPLGVLDELRELGQTTITTDPDAVPVLDEIDPERCYLSWTIDVETDADAERLRDVFLFVTQDCTVAISERLADGSLRPLDAEPAEKPVVAVPYRPASTEAPVPDPTGIAPAPGHGSNGSQSGRSPIPEVLEPVRPAVPAAASGPSRPSPSPQAGGVTPPSRPHARIRVDAIQLDDLVGLAGELVVLSDNLQGMREDARVARWAHALEALDRVSREIRDTTLELRMVPVDELFSRFHRVVRDLADRSGKEIDLKIVGQETRLDRTIIERLGDPMVHLIRNAVDHALELPGERVERGKPRIGKITLTAGHEGDRVAIRVEDDGRGLDRERIVRKGIAKGLIPPGTSPDDPRVVNLIFEPGFSTRDNVSELSGRGVGLDVVSDSIRALRGSLSVESTPGKGTAFVFRLPLTLALIDGLLIEAAESKFVVPLTQVEECVSLSGMGPALARERPCVSVRGELVPMVSLRDLFRSNGQVPRRQELLLTRHAGQRVGVAVDRLVGRVQAVIQSLGEGMQGLNRYSGATILGDGSVSLILDLSAVVSESLVADQGGYSTPSFGVRAEVFR
ncbi:chemotaxis protein CheA [Aquisphaera insulae]|uniref:chemotaxis protein CheA n=1 Tax=Aquisphaera insulae TaxID=2712864 RepID=UPI002030A863|nr:chemotaxis protein CheA [Aquisphaera insulae]